MKSKQDTPTIIRLSDTCQTDTVNAQMLAATPYPNPPYRMPLSKDNIKADAATTSGSPKRKRISSFILQPDVKVTTIINTSAALDPPTEDQLLRSPRSRVADRLGALDIRHADPLQDAGLPRKRVKRRQSQVHDAMGPQVVPAIPFTTNLTGDPATPTRASAPSSGVSNPKQLEIAETPDCHDQAAHLLEDSPVCQARISGEIQETPASAEPSTLSVAIPAKRSPKRMRSPPPPSPSTQLEHPPSSPTLGSQNSTGSQDSVDPKTLTWQDFEITGHNIDYTAQDDGEGINGVGFRPTPAIAAARSQRRKQQVLEWRARQTKEDRQKRFQKRQGCSDEAEDGEGKRAVRFAGVS